jgi:hypothetical protein
MNQRIGAVAGIAFIVLSLASMGLTPMPPGFDGTATEFVDWYQGSTTGIQVTAFLFGLSMVVAAVWFGYARAHVEPHGASAPFGPVATVGMAVMAVGWILTGGISSVVAMRIDELDAGVVVLGAMLAGSANMVSQFGLALLVGGVTAQAQITRSLPRWLIVFGWMGAALALVSTVGIATDSEAVELLLFANWVPGTVWWVGLSVVLWRSGSATGSDSAADAPAAPRREAAAIG